MSGTSVHGPSDGRPGPVAWLLESFWIADILVLGLLAFFVIVGGGSTAMVLVGCVLALLYAAHAVRRHRARGDALSAEDRRARERRGF